MVVHRSGENSVALYIDGAEIEAFGWEEISEEQARMLTEDALIGLGMQPGALMEIETYAGHDGVMIFAVLQAKEHWDTHFFKFICLEHLFEAADTLSKHPPAISSLYAYEDGYILRVSGLGMRFSRLLLILGEYALRLSLPEEYELFLKEHGKLLAERNALQRFGTPATGRRP